MKMKTKTISRKISLLDRVQAVKRRKHKSWTDDLSPKDLAEVHKIINEYHEGKHPNLGTYSLARVLIEHFSLKVKEHTVFMYIAARAKDPQ